MIDGRIVGMVTLMKTDYYPLPDTFPWVSTLFATEEFRGHRISEKLIDAANSYTRELPRQRLYYCLVARNAPAGIPAELQRFS